MAELRVPTRINYGIIIINTLCLILGKKNGIEMQRRI